MHLTAPTKKYEKSWKQTIREFEAEHQKGFWNIPEKPTDLNEYIQRTKDHAKGKNLPANWVQSTTYWLIDENKVVGNVNIRHTLTATLKKRGGHIGYAIRPSSRRKGYGTKILELALRKAQKIGLTKILITCGDDNSPSQKIIKKNNGQLKDTIEFEGEKVRRYWIKLA